MSNTVKKDARIAFRLDPGLAGRVDRLAAHSGHGRSEFMRLAIRLADSSMTMSEVEALGAHGPLPDEARMVRQEAEANLADIAAALKPKRLLATSMD